MTCTASAGLNQDGLLPSRASLPCQLGDKKDRASGGLVYQLHSLRAHEPGAEQALEQAEMRGLAMQLELAQMQ